MFKKFTSINTFCVVLCIVPIVLLSLSCTGVGEPSSGKQEGVPFLRCAKTTFDTKGELFQLPPLTIKREGYDISVEGIKNSTIVIGLLAGIGDGSTETIKNIHFFLKSFKSANVQAIVIAGGIGGDEKSIKSVLEALKVPIPIFISPGAQENFDVFRKSILQKRVKYPQFIDMTKIRRAKVGHISILSLPGYSNAFYLEAKERGCSYEAGDLEDIAKLAKTDTVNVLLSASPPGGSGKDAVDLGRGNVNIGDEALTQMMSDAKIDFGLFGHVYESGSNATGNDAKTPVLPGVWQTSLFLQAGSAGAVPVSLVNGGRIAGMAHIVEFSGNRSRYRTILTP